MTSLLAAACDQVTLRVYELTNNSRNKGYMIYDKMAERFLVFVIKFDKIYANLTQRSQSLMLSVLLNGECFKHYEHVLGTLGVSHLSNS